MTTLQDKLDNIYQTKLEIKSAIGTDSDVFSEYPAMIRSMAGGGVSYSYLDERLSYYVETTDLEAMGYATESYVTNAISNIPGVDLSSYVTYTYLESKEYLTEIPNTYATYAAISEMGYITYSYGDSIYVSYAYIGDLNEITEYILGSSSSEAPENVYATKYELGSYVSKDELDNASYATESYVTNAISSIPVIDTSSYVTYTYLESKEYLTEIPDTYATYAAIEGMGYLTSIPSEYITDTELSACGYATTTDLNNHLPYLGTLQAHYTNSEHFIPKTNNTYYLGNLNFRWQLIYTYNLYSDNIYSGNIVLSDTYNSIVNVNNTRINFQINQNNRFKMTNVEFAPVNNNGVNLGTSSEKFNKTYTSTLYAENAYINASTYLPVNTYWYDGSTYHWLGDMFS